MDAFDVAEYAEGVDVIKQGDNGDNFYIVESGILEVFLDGTGKVV